MRSLLSTIIHPALLAGCLWFVLTSQNPLTAALLALVAAQILLRLAENYLPAKPHWRQSGGEVATLIGITLLDYVVIAFISIGYEQIMEVPLTSTREELTNLIWPGNWHVLAQTALLFFLAEGIFYWIHRGIHSVEWWWRLSGHGFHHSFHNLHALNFLAAHPLELIFLTFPAALLGALFGAAPEAVLCATVLASVNGSVAHANIQSRAPLIGWLVTTPEQHRRHHSQEYAASNSNYSCNAIIWDRLFGTFTEGPVAQTGIGPTEPTLWGKFTLPFRQPEDVTMAPSTNHRQAKG